MVDYAGKFVTVRFQARSSGTYEGPRWLWPDDFKVKRVNTRAVAGNK